MTSANRRDQIRPPGFAYQNQALRCENVDLRGLALAHGTPLYVYSQRALQDRTKALDQAFGAFPHTLCYAVKANSNLSLLKMFAALGCGFDVVSGGELQRVLQAAPAARKKTVFSGVGKTRDEIELALRSGILMFNVESPAELDAVFECAARFRKRARIAIRVNPDVDAKTHPYISTGLRQHKFGIPIEEAAALYALITKQRYTEAAGVSVHIGSQIESVAPFGQAMERVAALVKQLLKEGHRIRYVDAGGGLGISYRGEPPSFQQQTRRYARSILQPLRKLPVHLLLEPGRFLVGPAGILLTSVLYNKTNRGKHFVIVDAAMNDLLRPALYSAEHEIVPVLRDTSKTHITVDVVGPVCESGDFLARDRALPEVREGELLAVLDAGAYGTVLGSNYNTRPRAPEVLVAGARSRVIRHREAFADMIRLETGSQ